MALEKNDNAYSSKHAMNYECLIRRVYNCGRYGAKGADADIYRRYIMRALMYRDEKRATQEGQIRRSTKNEQELLAEYLESLHEVVGYINVAILKALNTHRSLFSEEQIAELENARKLLVEPTVESVFEVINRAEQVMIDVKIHPS